MCASFGFGALARAYTGQSSRCALALHRIRATTPLAEERVATFKAIVIEKCDGGQNVRLADLDEANLVEGDRVVRVEWSTVNYKDGHAVAGKAPVAQTCAMCGGSEFCEL